MKLYTYTAERSLPRIALKGIPGSLYGTGMPFWEDLEEAALAAIGDIPYEPMVMLEINAGPIDTHFGVNGEEAWAMYEAIAEDRGEAAADEWMKKLENVESVQGYLELTGGHVVNVVDIPPKHITVLGLADPNFDWGKKIEFKTKPKPVSAWKQPLISRLLRSIFLPQHKLYGAGSRPSPSMGFISRFIPSAAPVEAAPDPDVVSGVPLVWAAGKTFRRGMRGAFGADAGDAVGQLVALRAGAEPGKYLGSGAKGAVYALGSGRVIKVTMDGGELQTAANLIGVRHPNLSAVHDVFIVSDGQKGAGIIVRDAVDTTLHSYNKKLAGEVDGVMDEVLAIAQKEVGEEVASIKDIDPKTLAELVETMVELLREDGCAIDAGMLLDLADAFRALRHYGILGIDFDSKNVGVVKKPSPRPVLFDYGLTISPPAEIPVLDLKEVWTA